MTLIRSEWELPNLQNARRLYLDFETTSGNPTEPAFDPFHGTEILGVCVTTDAIEEAYYVPMRHYRWVDGAAVLDPANLPIEPVLRWLEETLSTAQMWINPSVKFDARFAACAGLSLPPVMLDTVVLAKVIDSDRSWSGGYGLKELSGAWGKFDISRHEKALKEYLSKHDRVDGKEAKDYGLVPIDMMAEYGTADVIAPKILWEKMIRSRQEETLEVWRTEALLTPVLLDIELEGMTLDTSLTGLDAVTVQYLHRVADLEERFMQLLQEMGFSAKLAEDTRMTSDTDLRKLLFGEMNLPVLAWTEPSKTHPNGQPSLGKKVLLDYAYLEEVVDDPQLTELFKLLAQHKVDNKFLTAFLDSYARLHSDGVLYPDYNQSVRSARMSCKKPNAQQLNKHAKRLILPKQGEGFLCFDYKQMEFRLIVHYTDNQDVIQVYQDDPFTDFHDWVAEVCDIPRSAAKNINFAIGFGAGEKKIISMLAANEELRARGGDPKARAYEIFGLYHRKLDGLKRASGEAEKEILRTAYNDRSWPIHKGVGYVRNDYGRRLHVPKDRARVAFNRIVQSTGADVVKERLNAVSPRYNEQIKELGLRVTWVVHDEIGFTGPKDTLQNPEVIAYIAELLESPSVEFKVPLLVDAEYSDENWASCQTVPIDRSLYRGQA